MSAKNQQVFFFDPEVADELYETKDKLADALKLGTGQIAVVGVLQRQADVFAVMHLDEDGNEFVVTCATRIEAEKYVRQRFEGIAKGGTVVKVRRSIIPIDGPATVRDSDDQLITKIPLESLPEAIQKRLRKSPQCYAHGQLKDGAWVVGEEITGPRW